MAESIPGSSYAKEIWMEWVWAFDLQVLQIGWPRKGKKYFNARVKEFSNQKLKIKLESKPW